MTRRRAESWGRRAESVAALWLRLKGYRILARRVRTPAGEIDLVVRRGRSVAFVEVKARATLETAAFALTAHGVRRIARASDFVLARFCRHDDVARFDAIFIRPWRWPVHIEGAWLAG